MKNQVEKKEIIIADIPLGHPYMLPYGRQDASKPEKVCKCTNCDLCQARKQDQILSETIDKLKQARQKICQGWTQGCFARNTEGKPVSVIDPTATCFCFMGALPYDFGYMNKEIRKTLDFKEEDSLVEWNDNPIRTQKDVLQVIDRTLQRLETNNG
jgi:hypothetical protein